MGRPPGWKSFSRAARNKTESGQETAVTSLILRRILDIKETCHYEGSDSYWNQIPEEAPAQGTETYHLGHYLMLAEGSFAGFPEKDWGAFSTCSGQLQSC